MHLTSGIDALKHVHAQMVDTLSTIECIYIKLTA